jgi:hypothetical protein
MAKTTTKRGAPPLLSRLGEAKKKELSKKLRMAKAKRDAAKTKRTFKRGAPKPRKKK